MNGLKVQKTLGNCHRGQFDQYGFNKLHSDDKLYV